MSGVGADGARGGRAVARNAAGLYAVQLVSYLIPILEVPVLARAFGKSLYGEILFYQGLALTLSIFVEYGFNINAARQVSLARDQPAKLSQLFADITLAKLMLALPILLGLGLAGNWSGLASTPWLFAFVAAYFCAFGFSPAWYFQGLERMTRIAVLDVVLRMLGLAVLIWMVRGPEDFLLALPILVAAPLLNTVLTTWWCRSELASAPWLWRRAWEQLRDGFHFFIYRSAGNLILAAAPIMLGLAAGKAVVGEFAPAEKLVRGMTSLAMPFLTAAFPFFSRRLSACDDPRRYVASLKVLGVIAVLAACGTLLGYLLGAWALRTMLGDGFPNALTIYFLLLYLAPMRIMNQSLAMLVLLPSGRDRIASYLLSVCSVSAIVLGSVLAIFHGGAGMAVGLLVGEAVLFIMQLAYVWRILRAERPSA